MSDDAATTADSLSRRIEAVDSAIWGMNEALPDSERWRLADVYEDYVIVRQGAQLLQVPYAIGEDGTFAWGEPAPVRMEYQPIRAESAGAVALHEAADAGAADRGMEWEIEIIRPGMSKNGLYYPAETLRAAAPLFEGVHVFAFVDDGRGHKMNPLDKAPSALAGWIDTVAARADGVVVGQLHFLREGVGAAVRAQLVDAWQRGKRDLMGVSMDARGTARSGVAEGAAAQIVDAIRDVLSVEVVLYPAAGGRFSRLVASATDGVRSQQPTLQENRVMSKPAIQRLWALLESRRPDALAGLDAQTATADALLSVATDAEMREAFAPAAETGAAAGQQMQENRAGGGAATAVADAPSRAEVAESRILLRALLQESGLPAQTQTRLRERFEGSTASEQQLQAAIDSEREYLASINPARVAGLGGAREGAGVQVGAERLDRLQAGFDRAFGLEPADPALKTIKPLGFRALYNEITLGGDPDVRGTLQESAVGRMLQENFTNATLPRVVANTLYRRLARDYAEVDYGERRIISMIGSAADFKNQETIRTGYFGDIPAVNPETADYAEIAPYGEEAATYAVGQRGAMVTITRRHILNDDVGHVARVVGRLGRAARRTFAKFVWDFVRNNGNIYDGTPWFTAAHGNLLAVALDAAGLTAARNALFNQTEPSSGERLGLNPYLLVVPIELEAAARTLNSQGTLNNDNPHRGRFGANGENIIVNPLFTDPNDYVVFANPADVDTIEVKFLNGQEEPELFIADMPTVGQMFTGDKLQYKVRHEYGGAVTDFRGAVKSVVV